MSCCYCAADTIVCRGTCRHTALWLLQIPKSRLDCCKVSRLSTQIDLFLGFMSAGFFTTRLEKTLAILFDSIPCFSSCDSEPMHTLQTPKGKLLFKVVLSGWRGDCSSCEVPELLLALLSPSLSASVIFSTTFARKMCCVWYTQVQTPTSFTLPGWHCSVTVHGMMKGCITRIVKHSKSSTFYKIHRGKKERCGFSCMPTHS